MGNFIREINIFPYQNLWRMDKNDQVNHKCGGIISIFIFILVSTIAMLKFIEIFQKNVITVTTHSQISYASPYVYVTTSSNNPSMQQYMFAINLGNLDNRSDISIVGNASIQSRFTTFQLEPCTRSHFQNVAGVKENFQAWGMNDWVCLPLNQVYRIGGPQSQQIQISITCNSSFCSQSLNMSYPIYAYSLSTFINPDNGVQPFQAYMEQFLTSFQSKINNQNQILVDQTILITDQSIGPFAQQVTKNCLSMSSAADKAQLLSVSEGSLLYFGITNSGKKITINRQYQKIIDGFSYIGGIFNAVMGVFFFLTIIGKLTFQIKFASKIFHKKQFQDLSFCTYLRLFSFKILSIFNKQPDWKFQKSIISYRKTVNNLLDIIYLQKRLQFVQNAMTILFQKHQLSGLYLLHSLTKEEADNNYKNHRLRNRIIYYFQRKEQFQKWFQENNQINDIDVSQNSKQYLKKHNNNKNKIVRKQTSQLFNSKSSFNQSKPQIQIGKRQGMEEIIQDDIRIASREQIINKKEMIQTKKHYKNKNQKTKQINQDNIKIQSRMELIDQIIVQQNCLQSQQDIQFMDWPVDQLLQNQKINDQQFKKTLDQLKKLQREAKQFEGDPISKKIYKRIDKQLKIRLKKTIGRKML